MTHLNTIVRTLKRPAIIFAIVLVLFCVLVQVLGFSSSWRFDREAIANGHYWLLLSGNFVHLGLSHLGMNMAGLILIVALVWSRFNAWEWGFTTFVASLFVGVGLYQLDPSVLWYVGFSGTLHGLLLAGVLADLKYFPRSAAALLLFVIAKLGYEQVIGPVPGSESVAGGNVVVNSHLYGAVGGVVMGLILMFRPKRHP